MAGALGFALTMAVGAEAASLGPAVIASGAARLDNGSLVTLGQPFVVVTGSDGGVAPGLLPVLRIHPPIDIAPLGSWSPNGFSIAFPGQAGRDYVLLASTNLAQWTPIRTNRPLGPVVTLEDSTAGQFPWRFYRVSAP